ncbi:cell division control protein 45 [Zymoseptoria brevis]|uniref:Cell division control protein 45 n=1 Tax=Zymoseptoria brevis TaxID=1047168 RepID=A0A0F4GQR8_9PEZI|nr:cell division control protein 45 [Zymoseptoria brevis]
MYLPRQQIAQLYIHLTRSTHPSSAPVLILTSLTVDSLCATRILASLLKRDFIPHTIVPVAGYSDLQRAGLEQVVPLSRPAGGDGGLVVCLGLGGAVALEEVLGLEGGQSGIEIWVIDSHRPLNLDNVFGNRAAATQDDGTAVVERPGVREGQILTGYKPGRGGVIIWDDGDLEADLQHEKEAYFALQDMPEITEDDLLHDDDDDDDEEEEDRPVDSDEAKDSPGSGHKRKRDTSLDDSDSESSDLDEEQGRARRRRRSNSRSSIPIPSSPGGNPLSAQVDINSTPPPIASSPPKRKELSTKQLRKQLLKLRRKHEATLDKYYDLGTHAAEPVSSMLYSLASELGREDNELLWLAIVGVSSMTTSPSGPGKRANQIRLVLQDEVRRLNPIPDSELQKSQSVEATIPTTARSPTDTSIRLSPEPRFLLIRHWSLYDSMLHSPYLATRLHVWSDVGKKRLHKLLAKMGVSLQEAGKGYLHMDSELKRTLRRRILKFAEQYNLDGLVPGDNGRGGMEGWGFVRSWGWRGTLSAEDVAVVVGAILEVGIDTDIISSFILGARSAPEPTYNARVRTLPTPPHSSDDGQEQDTSAPDVPDYVTRRFFRAYDSLAPGKGLATMLENLPAAQNLYKAILRMGSALINKRQIRHLRAFRMAVVKEGPDVPLFTHPGALVRLAAWVGEAVAVLEGEKGRRANKRHNEALVLGALDESRGVYVVVGTGGGDGWNGSGKAIRPKAEIKEREEKKKRKAADRAARKAEQARKREEQRRLRKERNAANGLLDSDDESEEEEETESEGDESSDSDESEGGDESGKKKKMMQGFNRFGQAFQEVVEETGSRVRIDSFEHSVVEVKKEDLAGFLEALSLKSVVG